MPRVDGGVSNPRNTRSSRGLRTESPAILADGESIIPVCQDARILHLQIRLLRIDYAGIRASDPVAEAKLLASIAREGQKVPIIVVREEDDFFQVLDGFRRQKALEQLGQDVILGVEWPTGAIEGLVEIRRLRTASRSGPLEEGWLIEVLVDRHSLSLAEIAQRLGRTKSWVHRRLSLVRQLPEPVREKVLTGSFSGYVAAKFAVPLARANSDLVQSYCECVISHGLSTREAGVVYQYLTRTTDPSIQKEILARPQRVLVPSDDSGRKSGGAAGLEPVERLERWCRHTGSIHGIFHRLLARGLSEDLIERIGVTWNNHREIVRSVLRQLDGLAVHGHNPEALARANASRVAKEGL